MSTVVPAQFIQEAVNLLLTKEYCGKSCEKPQLALTTKPFRSFYFYYNKRAFGARRILLSLGNHQSACAPSVGRKTARS